MPSLPWPDYLDALEEWTRRAEQAVRGGEEPLRPLDEQPDGRLPAEHGLRARALLARMQQLQELGARRAAELDRARAYDQD